MFALMVREPQHQDQLQSMIFAFFKEYRIARLLKQSNITKQADIAVLDVFRAIFSLVFTQRSLNRWLKQSGRRVWQRHGVSVLEFPSAQLASVSATVERCRCTTDVSAYFR